MIGEDNAAVGRDACVGRSSGCGTREQSVSRQRKFREGAIADQLMSNAIGRDRVNDFAALQRHHNTPVGSDIETAGDSGESAAVRRRPVHECSSSGIFASGIDSVHSRRRDAMEDVFVRRIDCPIRAGRHAQRQNELPRRTAIDAPRKTLRRDSKDAIAVGDVERAVCRDGDVRRPHSDLCRRNSIDRAGDLASPGHGNQRSVDKFDDASGDEIGDEERSVRADGDAPWRDARADDGADDSTCVDLAHSRSICHVDGAIRTNGDETRIIERRLRRRTAVPRIAAVRVACNSAHGQAFRLIRIAASLLTAGVINGLPARVIKTLRR